MPTCKTCGIVVKFLGPSTGYRLFCSTKCSATNETTKSHRIQTNIKVYGAVAPAQNDIIKQKAANTCLVRYGTVATQSVPAIQAKTQATNKKKFGAEHYLASENCRQKTQAFYSRGRKTTVKQQKHSHMSDEALTLSNDPLWLREQNDNGQTLGDLAKKLQVSVAYMSTQFARYRIEPIKTYTSSTAEMWLGNWLEKNGLKIIRNSRQLLGRQELDIFIPSHNLAIEYCGLYWHSSAHPRMTPHYHFEKYEACANKGVRLITIFEDEFVHQPKSVLMQLKHILWPRKIDDIVKNGHTWIALSGRRIVAKYSVQDNKLVYTGAEFAFEEMHRYANWSGPLTIARDRRWETD